MSCDGAIAHRAERSRCGGGTPYWLRPTPYVRVRCGGAVAGRLGGCRLNAGPTLALRPTLGTRTPKFAPGSRSGPPLVREIGPRVAGAERAGLRARGRRDSSAVTFCGWWQAARWPPAYSVSCGSTWRQMSVARGQRVWKRQPDGGLIGFGGSPSITGGAGAVLVRVRDRDRAQQRRRVRMDRLGVELLGRRDLHQLAEVHDDDPVRDVADDAAGRGRRTRRTGGTRPGARRAG